MGGGADGRHLRTHILTPAFPGDRVDIDIDNTAVSGYRLSYALLTYYLRSKGYVIADDLLGNYSTITLREGLIDRGLTTVPTPKRPAKPPALFSIQRMLSNPYCKRDVISRGVSYDGLHKPLVSPEMWHRVQNVLHRPPGLRREDAGPFPNTSSPRSGTSSPASSMTCI